ncbi:MAG: hypothetical protein QOF51_249 [Chloroflexota bacterium]|nr:hypothetical protein [Chloroflexota bacterium]
MTYGELAEELGLRIGDAGDRERLAALLRAVSEAEHAAGRPLLSAIVVLQGRSMPGKGFFDLAREHDLHTGADDRAFHAAELARLFAWWVNPASSEP